MYTVFGYVRVSTENQLENYSIEEQIERIQSYCKAKGWSLAKIYSDGGYSGGNLQRPALKEMLEHLSGIDAVIVYKLDRLSRSQKDTLTLIEDVFLPSNTDFISINENFDTSTPFGRAMIGILSVFAQLEKDQITERFTMGRIGRSKAGYYHGGATAPTGYDYKGGRLVINEYEASIVREIFSRFLEGKSINAIVTLCQKQYPAMFWSAAKIAGILRNSVYVGKVKFAGKEYDGVHDPIINTETFETANRLLASPEREARKSAPQKTPFRAGYLLSGLVYCARCKARYSANHGAYKCYSRAKCSRRFIKDPNCKNDNWNIADLDAYVLRQIHILLNDSDALQAVIASAVPEEQVDTVKIQARLHEIDVQIGHIIDLYQIGSLPMEEIARRADALESEKSALQKMLVEKPKSDIEQFLTSLEAFRKGIDKDDTDTQRMYVSSVIRSIEIDGPVASIRWRI
ncbi:MAG: recombinase family protein [Clostridia bacterium]|nr:recombinase family protein [Clostridia bacterium]